MSKPYIKAKHIDIHPSARFGDNVRIICETVKLGINAYLGNNVSVECRKFSAGENLYMTDGVQVGRGGKFGENSNVIIGNNVGIFENTTLNPSESIHIGDNVGIGAEVMIWTHGAWLNVLDGFPSQFGNVVIEENVWLPARSIVLPNVTIGKNTVITINSVVNRSLPEGCLAGGNPAKVIRHNVYPSNSTDKSQILKDLCESHSKLLAYKLQVSQDQLSYKLQYDDQAQVAYVKIGIGVDSSISEGEVHIGVSAMPYTWSASYQNAKMDGILEDFRDYLRRNGVRIFTGRPFKSIKPYYLT